MRPLILSLLLVPGILLAGTSRAEDPPAADAKEPEARAEAFVPPDGWRPKKRGKFTVYCRKQSEQGTRIPKEVCYDEDGIRAMLASLVEEQEKVDQIRRICGSQAACGGGN